METLEQLLAKFKDLSAEELHLESSQKPYFTTPGGPREISHSPIQHRDIVQMISPILTPTVKSQLMEKTLTEFQHRSSSGAFMVSIKKSSLGFNVIIRLNSDNADSAGAAASSSAGIAAPSPNFAQSAPTRPAGFANPVAAPSVASSGAAQMSQPMSAPGAAQPMSAPPLQSRPIPSEASRPATPPVHAQSTPAAAPNAPRASMPASAPAASSKTTIQARIAPEMDKYFERMFQAGASDLHMSVGMPPMIRHDGEMKPLPGFPVLDVETLERLLYEIMPVRNREEFGQRHDTDFAYELPGISRFRSNIFMDRKGIGGVFRTIPTKILTAEQLGLTKAILDLCFLSKGLVVVTGPTGSGKSTTLAAMIDYINRHRKDHIITIEDPIEFVHENKACLLNQREVHNHTDSFKQALRAALREDPDIVLVGEMRDLETIAIAIETAETGHLVFGTLHTTTAASTVDRLIDQFPTDRQAQIRTMLSESLKGVVAQTLLKKKGGGRVAALEVLLVTPAVSNLIRESKTFQIASVMQTSKNIGMVSLNDALLDLVRAGTVSADDAYTKAVDKMSFREMCKRGNIELNV